MQTNELTRFLFQDLKILKSKEELKSEAAKAPVAGSSVVQVVKKKSKNAAEQPPPKYEEITIISVGGI